MPDGAVEFKGATEAMRDIARWADELGPAVVAKTQGLADQVASRVRSDVPKVSGTLAGSVATESEADGWGVSIGAGVDYAGWIEFGGSRSRPYIPQGRYLYPAALDAEDDFGQLAEHEADDSVGRFNWSTPSV